MADCDRNREACVLDNTGGGVPPPEEPLSPPQASRASAPVAASPSLASAAPASASAPAVSWATLATRGSRVATIRFLMITWRPPGDPPPLLRKRAVRQSVDTVLERLMPMNQVEASSF